MATERDSGISSQRLKKLQTISHPFEELPPAKWSELSGSSSGNFNDLVDLIVKEQFINACSEELAVYLLERGPRDLVELTTWAQPYLVAHKQQLGGKTKSTVQPKCTEQRKPTQSKLDTAQERQRLLQCYRSQGYGHRQSECPTKVSPGKDQKSLTPVARVTRRRLVQWWQWWMKMVKRLLSV